MIIMIIKLFLTMKIVNIIGQVKREQIKNMEMT